MSITLAIAAGAGLVSVGTAVYQAYQDRQDADRARGKSDAFNQEQIDAWAATYGKVEDNLANYYSNLTPEAYAAEGIQAVEQFQQQAMTGIRQDLADRGIESGGALTSAETNIRVQGAQAKAKARAEAPMRVAKEQQKFLQMGMSKDPRAVQGRALEGAAARAEGEASLSEVATGAAVSKLASIGTQAAIEKFGSPGAKTTNVEPIPNTLEFGDLA